MRRTKIVATVGPASRTPEMLSQLMEAGVDICRLNFSHGTQAEHGESLRRIRELEERRGRPAPVLQDLAGPKIRIGCIKEGGIILNSGDTFILTTANVKGTGERVSVSYDRLPEEVSPGDTLLLSDGALELRVIATHECEIECKVMVGGHLTSHKGINLPSASVDLPVLTEKDRSDLAFGLQAGVDMIAVSFVRNAQDIAAVRQAMEDIGHRVPVIAKIEKHEALDNIDEITEAVDGLMIARGDLGVEIPIECIPPSQKWLTTCGNRAAKPVITATHMLRSMVSSPRPTRAEVTDIANAVLDGSDAIMLSEETAVGDYPRQSVEIMDRTIREIEEIFPYAAWDDRLGVQKYLSDQEAVAHAACGLAAETNAVAIVTCTMSGSTTTRVAKYRPAVPILALTPNIGVWRWLRLLWGVIPVYTEGVDKPEYMEQAATRNAVKQGLARPGQKIVITAGVPLKLSGATNLVKVVTVSE